MLANRLSEDSTARVLLIEAGKGRFPPIADIPLSAGILRGNPRHDWCYTTEPEPHLNGRVLSLSQGLGLGGSSTINGMVYLRGHQSDFDSWETLGNRGWSWADVFPYFEKVERRQANARNGMLYVKAGRPAHPLDEAFLAAGVTAGYPETPSFSDGPAEGFGCFDFNIHRGRRWSAWRGYLRPALGRKNLTVQSGAQVTRILFDGKRALGAEWISDGSTRHTTLSGEVILCAGAIGSPTALLLSGIGNPDHLRDFGIDVVAALPGVGRNLQNHPDVTISHSCTRPITLHSLLRADRMMFAMARAWLAGSGPATGFPGNAGAFLKSKPDLQLPDLECHLVWANRIAGTRIRWPLLSRHDGRQDGFSVRIALLKPRSRGEIRLASPDPLARPRILHNYLDTQSDCDALASGARLIRRVLAQHPFDQWRGPEIDPGPGLQDETALSKWVRGNVETQGHPVGTCRMGPDDQSVVDAELKVKGMVGLRVVDASVMPNIPMANTFATTIMIAEKAADMILGTAPNAR